MIITRIIKLRDANVVSTDGDCDGVRERGRIECANDGRCFLGCEHEKNVMRRHDQTGQDSPAQHICQNISS